MAANEGVPSLASRVTADSAAVDPEDELFWHDVKEAFRVVWMNPAQEIKLEQGGKRAVVYSDNDPNNPEVHIIVGESTYKPKQTLIVPGE